MKVKTAGWSNIIHSNGHSTSANTVSVKSDVWTGETKAYRLGRVRQDA